MFTATSCTDEAWIGSRRIASTTGKRTSAPAGNRARTSRPVGLSGACTRAGMPIRSRKSRIDSVTGSSAGVTIRTVSTSGSATVEPQSESISVTAVWNSSSRTPRGISR